MLLHDCVPYFTIWRGEMVLQPRKTLPTTTQLATQGFWAMLSGKGKDKDPNASLFPADQRRGCQWTSPVNAL